MDVSADTIRESLAKHQLFEMGPLPGRTNHIKAGVLVPLVWDPQLCVLLTIRSAELRVHPGDPCFPGGRREPGDSDLLATALRESREEMGICEAEVLGRLSSVPLYTSDHRIEPFVAAVRMDEVKPNPAEVEEVLRIPLEQLLHRPQLDAIPWFHNDVEELSPVFAWQGHLVYGATAHTLYELLAVVAASAEVALPPLVAGRFTWKDAMPDFVAPWA